MKKSLRVCHSKDIDATDLDGEKVMMNLELGRYFALNPVGSRIWELMNNEISVEDIIKILLSEYNVEEQTCEKSVLEYLEKLKNADLIKIV
ncbi:lasso peptide biosynthesis PqqD family chaperone [Clostridium sp. SM-530-WT-3G]|uniref:lasso peptide biosynthesis PqqD family chaperone n=1 Tax=Clostridium sp. SM-530-WT-3G TaxID=2725303 RepID=UPI00145E0768|nr:lasso peptide biosynthesis PqqD family chaperone [Clostridium sp. SM-530-WT-3G]NME83415.1 lasso peptide biosynthesis PqqD family chaperone [Clostridium sp. SM-530-WT-3G]